jgi:hypothetical protein
MGKFYLKRQKNPLFFAKERKFRRALLSVGIRKSRAALCLYQPVLEVQNKPI